MALGLVARSAVAIADALNAYYRVFKGSDPENVYVRLPTAGSFEVRHSVTNAPVFRVTDAGMVGGIDGSNIADNTISSAELEDDTIVNADVNSAAAIAITKLAHIGPQNVFKSNGTTNAPGQVLDADVSATAGIAVTKLGGGGTANRVVATADGTNVAMQQVTSAMIADNTLVDADVNSAAGIAVTKVAHVGVNNVLKSNGTSANVGGQVVNADVAAGAAIAYSKLSLAGSITSADITDGAIVNADVNAAAAIAYGKLNLANSIVTGDIVDGTIVNADVNAAAGIAITKLADVGANNVLRSSGAGNVAGKIVTNDMVINTINGDRIIDATILGSKISGGAPPPNGTGAPDAYKVYATGAAGTTVSLQPIVTQMLSANQVGIRRLSYTLVTDIFTGSGLGAGLNADVVAAQSFTVDSTTSIVGVSAYAAVQVTSTTVNASAQIRVFVDAAALPIGAGVLQVASGFTAVGGGTTIWLTGLAAGSHTVRINILAGAANLNLYMRAASNPNVEFAGVSVVEILR